MRKILVAISGSDQSLKVLEIAFKLAKSTGAKLYIMHVVPSVPLTSRLSTPFSSMQERKLRFEPLPQTLKFRVMRNVLALLEKCRCEAEKLGVSVDFIICEGEPSRRIMAEAKKGYDLVVLGYSSAGWISPFARNVTLRVLKYANIPVLVVK